MSRHFSRTETIAIVRDLTEGRLSAFMRARIVQPVTTEHGPAFREADLARLQLLCDLSECYEMGDDALVLVMSLVDQLHLMRGDMRALMTALASEPDELRRRLGGRIRQSRPRSD